ncbi:MAG: adenylate/guanylate cyclase domain-containing protein [Bacteroidota bacterium]
MMIRRLTLGQKSTATKVGLAFAIAVLIILLTQDTLLRVDVLQRVELAAIDYRFQVRGSAPDFRDDSKVVIVEISEESFKSLPEKFPWPRSYYARVVRNLKSAGARVVGIDVTFDDPDAHSLRNDDVFRDAIRETGVVVLAGKREADRPLVKITSLRQNFGNIFYSVDSSLGLVNIRPDVDGIYRLYNVYYLIDAPGGREIALPTLAFAVLNKYLSLSPRTVPEPHDGFFTYHTSRVPKYDAASFLINYRGPSKTFPHVYFHDVIDDESFTTVDELVTGEEINTFSDPDFGYLHGETFKDKIVLIGVTVPEYKDLFPISLARGEQKGDNLMYGVEIHANAVQNVLQGDFLTRQSTIAGIGFTLLLAFLTFFVTSRLKVLRARNQSLVELYSFLFSVALMILVGYTSIVLFTSHNYVINITNAFLAIVGGYGGSTVYHLVSERKQRVLIKSMFSTYLNPSVVEELLAHPEKLVLGGKREELTVLFSDIQGFTSISQDMPPEELVSLLNEYLSVMSEIVFRHRGTLDKYEGDAVMAFWGAPVPQKDHPFRACLSALEMQNAVKEINESWQQQGKPRIRIRVGINTGEMVVGNLGGIGKFDYTVIGDSVNLASRLEGANKEYGTGIMVSHRTYELVKERILGRQLDRIAVKGRSEPVTTFELLQPVEGEIDVRLRQFLWNFESGLESYFAQEWDKAELSFNNSLQIQPDDRPTQVHLKRIQEFRLNPPPSDWDGVFVMTQK